VAFVVTASEMGMGMGNEMQMGNEMGMGGLRRRRERGRELSESPLLYRLGAKARVGCFRNFRWEGVWEQQRGRLGGREIFRVLGGKIFRAFILSFNYLNNVIKICSNVEIGLIVS
jgi:hypothetical protein